ncbi:hypothetical protein J4573_08845 [Actinomadura barringtoniae]|uniref:Uncharacterized protein n=1 Tax=Actinomadura barringtoniae TaxID=1427535 RepID=A0A939T3T5_9ACTN|nr:hypothetical protein [Actinomadura barringtoniae]MBO2447189.1 hypothetical protein [Actinomadura barringtoniae]
MRPETTAVVARMARREAAAGLLTAPRVEFGERGTTVLVQFVPCPECGPRGPLGPGGQRRAWSPPFRDDPAEPGPVLHMLACEAVTARAVLLIVLTAERTPALANAEFTTRAVTWLEVAHLGLDKALEAMDTAETWATGGRTLPASTRRHHPGAAWETYRRDLVPSFLSPHADVPAELELYYEQERRAAVLKAEDLKPKI